MADRKPFLPSSPRDHVFPRLTPAQLARIAAHGRLRPVAAGEVLLEAGEPTTRMFVVRSGQIEVVRLGDVEQLVAVFEAGQFTGEMNILTGRRSLARVGATQSGEVVEVRREDLLALDEALEQLAGEEATVAQLVKLRYFAGLTIAQTAAALGISVRTANRHWAYARAWLYEALGREDNPGRGGS